jgi:hypothetical protein
MNHAIAKAVTKSRRSRQKHLKVAQEQYEITLKKVQYHKERENHRAIIVYTVRAFALFNYIHELRKEFTK